MSPTLLLLLLLFAVCGVSASVQPNSQLLSPPFARPPWLQQYSSWVSMPVGCPADPFPRAGFSASALVASPLWANVTASLDALLDQLQDWYHAHGYNISGALEVVIGGRAVFSAQRVVKNRHLGYVLGSVSKCFATQLYYTLMERGVVSPFTQPGQYFNAAAPPAFSYTNPFGPTAYVALANLADHSSGLIRDAECDSAECYMKTIASFPLRSAPGTTPVYSNVGVSVLGQTLARAVNKTYSALAAELFQQMGMTTSGFDVTNSTPMVPGTSIINGKQVPSTNYLGPAGFGAPAGDQYSSPADMSAWMGRVLDAWAGRPSPLGGTVVRQWMKPSAQFRDSESGYGAGVWERFNLGSGLHARTKLGLVSDFAASVALVPELDIGVSYQTNVNSGGDVAAMTAAALTYVLVPALSQLAATNAPPLPVPPGAVDVTGKYGDGTTVFVTIRKVSPAQPNAPQLVMNVGGVDYGMWYNERTSQPDVYVSLDYETLSPTESCGSIRMGDVGTAYLNLHSGYLFIFYAPGPMTVERMQ